MSHDRFWKFHTFTFYSVHIAAELGKKEKAVESNAKRPRLDLDN